MKDINTLSTSFLYGTSLTRLITRQLLAVVLILATVSLIGTDALAQKTPPDPGVGGNVYGLEIDADFYSGENPDFWASWSSQFTSGPYGADWSGDAGILNKSGANSIPGRSADGRTLWQQDGNWGNKSAVAEISTFSGTSNKNGQLINSVETSGSPYTVQLGGSGPQKNDITDMFLHTREVMIGGEPHTVLFFGAGTRATSGASYLDFEYNQAGVTVADGYMTGNGPVGGRTEGDFILVINYEGGGSKPVVGYRVWLASGIWSEETQISGTPYGYITTNITDIAPVAPNMGFKGDGAFANVTGALQFVEGGVDITGLELTGADLCNPEATLTVKTRSSPSFTAELKDLSVATFPLVPAATLADLSPVTACPDGSAVFSTTVSGDGASASNVAWFKGNSTTPIADDGNKYNIEVSGNTSTLTINNLVEADEATYRAVLSNATCGNPEETATLTINPAPSAGTGTAPDAQCYIASGNTFLLAGSGANGTPSWVVESNPSSLTVVIKNGNTFQPTVQVTGVGSVILRLTVTSDQTPSCGTAYDDVILTVSPSAAGPSVTYNAPACDEAVFSVTVNDAVIGVIYTIADKNGGNIESIEATNAAPDVIFTNRPAGSGYSVTANIGDCISEPTSCGTPSSDPIAAGAKTLQAEEIIQLNNKLVAYPVPFSDKLNLEFYSELDGGYQISLYDINGKLIRQLKAGTGKAGEMHRVEVDGTNLADGVYMVNVVNGSERQTLRIIKKQ